MSKAKIAAAARTTDHVFAEVDAAKVLLADFMVNGHGVLANPSDTRAAIRSAIDRLSEARRILEASSWPTNADYDEGEG